VNSRQRIIDHGEVFTPPGLVNDMLDLVANECERIDSRFLEPACGDGNFLAEVFRRRLSVVGREKRAIHLWEQDALLALACLYGIELLFDNVIACRQRLLGMFADEYANRFGKRCRDACVDAAQIIVHTNILHGDALAMTTVGDSALPNRPLIFTEWSLLPRGFFKRKQFEFHQLLRAADATTGDLFGGPHAILSDTGQTVFIEKAVRDLPLIHYLKLGREAHA